MAKNKVTILPEAMRDITITIGTQKIDVKLHWRIKAGYMVAMLGIKLIDFGSRFAGLNVKHEDPEE